MNLMQDITIDVLKPRQTVIHVVQEDSTRKIRLTLLKNNLPFDISQDLDAGETVYGFVEFRKADGHGGMYDTTSLGDPAVELEDAETATNVWIVALDGNCFTAPGWTQINVRFETEDGKRIHTFRIMVDVEPTASSDTESTDWGELNSIGDMRAAILELQSRDTGLSDDAKLALLNCFSHVAWVDEHGADYYDALETELYRAAGIVSISAVFVQGSEIVYSHDDLDSLRKYLTVSATYEDATVKEISQYVLDGDLTAGTSTITVSYGGKTTTFDVVVTAGVPNTFDVYDYIECTDESGASKAKATWIILKQFANLNAVSLNTTIIPTYYESPPAFIGRRSQSGNTASFAFYANGVSGNMVLGHQLHGGNSGGNIQELVADAKNTINYQNTSASPSYIQVNDQTPTPIEWQNTNVLNLAPVLFGNPVNDTAATLSHNVKIGTLVFTDLSDNEVGRYFAVVRKSDRRIGMYDIVNNSFHTTSTGAYSTIGNVNCIYAVGKWG